EDGIRDFHVTGVQTCALPIFRVTHAALEHLPSGSAIINSGSVNGLRGNAKLIDYSATKGAVHAWTYAMAQALRPRGIRVNCVARSEERRVGKEAGCGWVR